MQGSKSQAEAKMEKLAATVKRGWAKRHPLTDGLRAMIRERVRTQAIGKAAGLAAPLSKQQKRQPKPGQQRGQGKTQDDDLGLSH